MISPFNKKLIILSDVYLHYRDDDEFKEFAEYNDLGLPLAHVCATGLAEIKPYGVDCIEETYDLCVGPIYLRITPNLKQHIKAIKSFIF